MILRGQRVLGTNLAGTLDGWIRVERDLITAVGAGDPPPGEDATVVEGWLAPGLVDIHVHGGGGASFQSGEMSEVRAVVGFHRSQGTTTLVASLVTDGIDRMAAAAGRLATAVAAGLVAGVHLEGPFLATAQCGAHHPDLLRMPTADSVERLLTSGPIRVVTLAPELPGALDAIRRIVDRGVVAAVGHTDASYADTRRAIDAGARLGTHLFNAMPPLHHREPGPVLGLLADPRVMVELIDDGVHVHPDLVGAVLRARAGTVVLVTDAIAAAGLGDGQYRLGPQPVIVRNGVARLAERSSLAGSTLVLAEAVRNAVEQGVEPATAVAAATSSPANLLGLHTVGRLVPGCRADLIAFDDHFATAGVWFGGQRIR